MNAEEKQAVYTLLRTASQNIYGYTPASFSEKELPEEPVPAVAAVPVPPATPSAEIHMQFQESQVSPKPQTMDSKPQEVPSPAPAPASPAASSSGLTMGEVILKIARCTRCALARTRMSTVPGIGVKNPEVLVIGEGPSAADNDSGLPFTGPAGQLLDKMLLAIKLERNKNCYLTNIVKCMPPQNRDPYPDEAEACFGYLEAQIKILNPKMILCAGRVAAVSLLKNNQNVNLSHPVEQLRGRFYDYNGIPVAVIHSPESVLRNQALKRPVWEDLKAFAAKLGEISPSYAALSKS